MYEWYSKLSSSIVCLFSCSGKGTHQLIETNITYNSAAWWARSQKSRLDQFSRCCMLMNMWLWNWELHVLMHTLQLATIAWLVCANKHWQKWPGLAENFSLESRNQTSGKNQSYVLFVYACYQHNLSITSEQIISTMSGYKNHPPTMWLFSSSAFPSTKR